MQSNLERMERIRRRTAQLQRQRRERRQRGIDTACVAACLVLDAFAFLLPGVVATITAMHVIRKDKNKFRKQVRKPMPKR